MPLNQHDTPATHADAEADLSAPVRVLLVDDQDDLRSAFARLFRDRGFEVVEATSGKEAVVRMQQASFDAVVSDVQMPDMNGVDLLRAVRERDPELACLLISGAPDLQTALQAVEYGAIEYLTKPLEFDHLVASVERAAQTTKKRRLEKEMLEQVRSGERSVRLRRGHPASFTGALLAGRYRVGALIGIGGMGAVYEAVREDLGQMPVAVKIVHAHLGADPGLLLRFRREAETIAALNHQNIVRVLDFYAPDDEPAFLVMERLIGESLATLITAQGPLSVERVVFIATQTLFALEAAHERHVVHRDLKPENIFLTSVSGVDDVVRVLDFGIAKWTDQDQNNKLTKTGAVIGTPAYMAPEQARGTMVDPRSDLYALGCVMYEALTGLVAFEADNYNALLVAIQESEPRPLLEMRPDLKPELVAIVSRAMAKDLSVRYQSAKEMLAALLPWSPAKPPSTRPPEEPLRAALPTDLDDDPRFRTTRRDGWKPSGESC